MGPICNNYGTFLAVDGTHGGYNKTHIPAFSCPSRQHSRVRSGIEHRMLRDWHGKFGLRLHKKGKDVVVLEVNDDVARAGGLSEGCIVTHMDGRGVAGSLQVAAQCIEEAGTSLVLRVQGHDCSLREDTNDRKKKDAVVHHVVRQGDSVDTLASSYDVTTEQIRTWNRKHFPVGEPGFVVPGQILTLRTTAFGHHKDAKKAVSGEGYTLAGRRRSVEVAERRRRCLYEVRAGDTLKSISACLNVKEEEIRLLNRGVFPVGEAGVLYAGQTLTVFAAECDELREEKCALPGSRGRQEESIRNCFPSKTRRSARVMATVIDSRV